MIHFCVSVRKLSKGIARNKACKARATSPREGPETRIGGTTCRIWKLQMASKSHSKWRPAADERTTSIAKGSKTDQTNLQCAHSHTMSTRVRPTPRCSQALHWHGALASHRRTVFNPHGARVSASLLPLLFRALLPMFHLSVPLFPHYSSWSSSCSSLLPTICLSCSSSILSMPFVVIVFLWILSFL